MPLIFSVVVSATGLTLGASDLVQVSGTGTALSPYTAVSGNQNQHSTTAFAEFAVVGSGALFYDVRVASEANWDFARLIVRGVTEVNISGATSQSGSVAVNDADVVRFEYGKDGSVSRNSDTGYLDALYVV